MALETNKQKTPMLITSVVREIDGRGNRMIVLGLVLRSQVLGPSPKFHETWKGAGTGPCLRLHPPPQSCWDRGTHPAHPFVQWLLQKCDRQPPQKIGEFWCTFSMRIGLIIPDGLKGQKGYLCPSWLKGCTWELAGSCTCNIMVTARDRHLGPLRHYYWSWMA